MEIMEKVPPQALDAEKAVLGAMLIEPEAISKASDILQDKNFYKEAHRTIFEAILRLYSNNEAVDLVTVSEALKKSKILTDVGGSAYLTDLIQSVSTAANVEHYAKIVREKAILRDLIQTGTRIVHDCFQETEPVEKVLDKAEGAIFAIASRKSGKGFVPISSLIHDAIEKVETLYQRKEHVTGVPTGFSELDAMTAGLQPANLIIVAGRPSMGKTSFCLNIAEHAAIVKKLPVAVFSMEMSSEEILLRMLCSEARVNAHDVRRGFLPKKYWTNLTNAASRLSEAPIYIDDSSNLSVLEMRARARRLAAELKTQGQELGLIMIDYLQLMHGSGRLENRQQEISEISRSLKGMARDLSLPVIALSQLSRRPEEKGRDGGRPQLSDLRESGALEQDADMVAFIYREEMYRPDDPALQGKAKIIVGKQRNGPTGEIELTFIRDYTKFENPAASGPS